MTGLTFSLRVDSLVEMNPAPIRLVVCFFILGVAGSGSAQFVAFNDANPGTGTHPNATTYGGINNTAPLNLKDIVTGASLGASLQIGRMGSGGIGSSICCAVPPAPNSPASNTFGAYAAFPGGDLVYLNTSFSYIQSFNGLDPAREYSLRGTVCARNPPQDAWLLVDLQGASAATHAHSPGCLSKTNFPSLRERQVL